MKGDRSQKISFVVMHHPVLNFESPECREVFDEMALLKIRGYGRVYPRDRVFALDTHDWVSSHVLAFDSSYSRTISVFGYKFVRRATCKRFGLAFPGESIFANYAPKSYLSAVQRFLGSENSAADRVGYSGSWTVDPAYRQTPGAKETLGELLIASHRLFQNSYSMDRIICCAATDVKAHVLQQRIGYRMIVGEKGEALAPFSVPVLNNASTIGCTIDSPSNEALALAEKYSHAWQARTEIGEFEPWESGAILQAA